MFTRGHAKHPCTQHVYSQGFLHNTLLNIANEYMGSQWVVFDATDPIGYERKGGPCDWSKEALPLRLLGYPF